MRTTAAQVEGEEEEEGVMSLAYSIQALTSDARHENAKLNGEGEKHRG